jgi:predicted DNA-binding transcriptional regulator AlpA
MDEKGKFLSIRDTAQMLGMRLASVYRAVWDGALVSKKSAEGHWQVSRKSVEAYLARRNQNRRGSSK